MQIINFGFYNVDRNNERRVRTINNSKAFGFMLLHPVPVDSFFIIGGVKIPARQGELIALDFARIIEMELAPSTFFADTNYDLTLNKSTTDQIEIIVFDNANEVSFYVPPKRSARIGFSLTADLTDDILRLANHNVGQVIFRCAANGGVTDYANIMCFSGDTDITYTKTSHETAILESCLHLNDEQINGVMSFNGQGRKHLVFSGVGANTVFTGTFILNPQAIEIFNEDIYGETDKTISAGGSRSHDFVFPQSVRYIDFFLQSDTAIQASSLRIVPNLGSSPQNTWLSISSGTSFSSMGNVAPAKKYFRVIIAANASLASVVSWQIVGRK